MLKLSLDGLTSFSSMPLKLAGYAGGALTFAGFLYLLVILFLKLFTNTSIAGWNVLAVLQFIFTGLIFMVLGIFGEYIGRIYDESRDRPLYIVRECYGIKKKEKDVRHVV
ncbi:hypothetical protein LJK87_05665 [Paenibacillus sp. P25]|nr:hypothetical protein LJK87_05665 [Paenibacillus sp. P25]